MSAYYKFLGSNLQTVIGYGSDKEAELFAAKLNAGRDVNLYGHAEMTAEDVVGLSPAIETRDDIVDLEVEAMDAAAKAGHTPGPWKARFNEDHETHDVIAGSSSICDLPAWERSAANARLIAAAPELLEALKSLVHVITTDGQLLQRYYKLSDGSLGDAHNAIAKAEGNT